MQEVFYDESVERYILGAMLVDDETTAAVIHKLGTDPTPFYIVGHQILYNAIADVYDERSTVDPVMVADRLKKTDQLNRVGGTDELYNLFEAIVETENIAHYLEILNEKYMRRKLTQTSIEIRESAQNPNIPIHDNIALAQRKVVELSIEETESLTLKDHLVEAVDTISKRATQGNTLIGAPTGFKWLDALTTGFQAGQLIILAARPGVGKTALALNMATTIAEDSPKPVLHFSLEMPSSELTLRMLSSTSGISLQKLRMGNIAEDEWKDVYQASETLGRMNMLINDNTGVNDQEIAAHARHLKNLHGDLALIIVDYLQLVRGGDGKYSVREQEVASVTRSLKRLAGDLDVPVLACAQLSRLVERRPGKEPQLSDLRESGAIEQDADIVMMLHKEDETTEESYAYTSISQSLMIKKHRNGPLGTLVFKFFPNIVKFQEE